SYGSMGAAVMSGKACLRSGAGLLTAFLPKCGVDIFQSTLPEAMVVSSDFEMQISGLPNLEKYYVIGVGPGLGISKETTQSLRKLLDTFSGKMVWDADALNILAANPDWWKALPENTVLTPHPGEFKRLLGAEKLDSTYLEKLS